MESITIEVGKFYKTRAGQKAFICSRAENPFGSVNPLHVFRGYVQDKEGEISWQADGIWYKNEVSSLDLIEVWKEPKRIKGWVALWKHSGYEAGCSHVFPTRAAAVSAGFGGVTAYFQIDVLEGYGLDGSAS